MNEIEINCIRGDMDWSARSIVSASRLVNRAHPPMANIINEKYITPGVFHQRVLIKPMTNAMAAVSKAIISSDVNCPVNAMSSVIDI